jgi:transposase
MINLEALEKVWRIKEKRVLEEYRKDQGDWRKIKRAKRLRLAGLKNKEIAEKLGIHPATVTRYVNSERKNF